MIFDHEMVLRDQRIADGIQIYLDKHYLKVKHLF